MANIRKDLLVASIYSKNDMPELSSDEIAFCGRSNCGKSSLINSLFGSHRIAKTSSKPGKTVSINFFKYSDSINVVDLPGFGYAKVAFEEQKKWKDFIDHYLFSSKNLECVFMLCDVRRGLQDTEIDFADWVMRSGLNLCFVFTKTDKLSGNQLANTKRQLLADIKKMWQYLPDNKIFFISSLSKQGVEKLKEFIDSGDYKS
jgi:GTP-binding protein